MTERTPPQPARGFRVIELATWVFVPAAASLLAEWGAEVIKIEHPERPDPQRTLSTVTGSGLPAENPMWAQINRGKRSVALDVSTPGGRDVLARLVRTADVFMTNILPGSLHRLQLAVAQVWAWNPRIIYARGSGYGPHGPEANRPGFDGTAYWARGGFAQALAETGADRPAPATPAIGDLPASVALAAGVVAALLERERTGEASVVDASLLGMAAWTMAPQILAAEAAAEPETSAGQAAEPERMAHPNPLTLTYRTGDGGHVKLSMFESDRYFGDLCQRLGVSQLATDPRFSDAAARARHSRDCIRALDVAFAELDATDVAARLRTCAGAWDFVRPPAALRHDEQALANGYVETESSASARTAVRGPVQFDAGRSPMADGAPEHGASTDEVLAELGFTWDEIVARKLDGSIL